MTGEGQLHVTVESKSYWLSQHLPYVVRDAGNAFVAEGVVGDKGVAELPEGYYSVEAIAPDGAPSRHVVQIVGGETCPLVIRDDHRTSTGDDPAVAPPQGLVQTDLCTAVENDDGWTFTPAEQLTKIPTARFLLESPAGTHGWVISLPLNPRGAEPKLRECRVRIEAPAAGPAYPVGSFPRKRRVGRMLDGVLRHRQVASAPLLDEAAGLLLDKYKDPPAAALGGLTLHRFGRLQERQDWIENLARDFTWLPDGQILLAALLMHDDVERARGLDVLLSATVSRPLYTDGLSLASELLRRWPGGELTEERAERLGRLSEYAAAADWNAVMLTTREDT